jgi:hypothetical protein
MAEPNNTPRPLSPEAEERTPLLSTGGGESSAQQQGAEQTAPLPSSEIENVDSSFSTSRTFRLIKATTYISLISSIICLILFLADHITSEISPYGSYGWQVEEAIAPLGMFVCALLSYETSLSSAAKSWSF